MRRQLLTVLSTAAAALAAGADSDGGSLVGGRLAVPTAAELGRPEKNQPSTTKILIGLASGTACEAEISKTGSVAATMQAKSVDAPVANAVQAFIDHKLENADMDEGFYDEQYDSSYDVHVDGSVEVVNVTSPAASSKRTGKTPPAPAQNAVLEMFDLLVAMEKSEDGGHAVAQSVHRRLAEIRTQSAEPDADEGKDQRRRRRLTAESVGAKPTSTNFLSSLNIAVLEDPDKKLNSKEMMELAKFLPCLTVQPDISTFWKSEDFFFSATNDPMLTDQYHHDHINSVAGWERFTGATRGEPIAVVDTGCSFHPDLADNFWIDTTQEGCDQATPDNPVISPNCYGVDFGDNNGNPMDEPSENLHGTAVAGTISAKPNNSYIGAGVCWGCKIICLKVSQGPFIPLDGVLMSYDWMIANKERVRVSNHSYGAWFNNNDAFYETALAALDDAGHLMVVAAGNDGCNLATPSDASLRCPGRVLYPGGRNEFPGIISVGATDIGKRKAWFTNFSPSHVDFFAPGDDIVTLQNTRFSDNGYTVISGTSFASPIVAGAAAMVWAANPSLARDQVRFRLQSTVTLNSDLSGFALYEGILNLGEALKDSELTDPETPVADRPLVDFTDFFYLGSNSAVGWPAAASLASVASAVALGFSFL